MGSGKSTVSKSVLGGLLILVIGIGIGLLIGDIPYITFEKEIDLGACIAIVGLIATVFYIPYIVERKFVKLDNINEVIRNDIESIHDDVVRLKAIYVAIKPDTIIRKAKFTEIVALFKTISASILELNEELDERGRLKDFKKDVYDGQFVSTKETCTETLMIDKKMNAKTTLDAVTELDKLCAKLKKYRYKTYADK